MTPEAPDEFVTVAEAARRLGVHERQIRRDAERLDLTDRTPKGHSPLRVRLSSLSRVRASGQVSEVRLESGQDRQDNRPDSVRSENALTTQLRSENQFLRTELEKRNQAESELRRLMLADRGELMELRQQVRLLQAAPPVETPPSTAPGGAEEMEESKRGHSSVPEVKGTERRPWWRFFSR